MPGTATTILIDGTPTNGSDPWVDSLVWGGAWTDADGGRVTISYSAAQGYLADEASMAWSAPGLTALGQALALWESVANIDFVETDSTNADVLFWQGMASQMEAEGALGWSDVPGYSDAEVFNVVFNGEDSSWSAGGLAKGGLGFVTLVHEVGHLLGLAHPHDGGSAADANAFPGVESPFFDYGTWSLNQGLYTTMGYNQGWPTFLTDHASETYGLQAGPMALDIAAIQEIYGANTTYAAGDDTYLLPMTNSVGAFWSCIWDTGGIDTISAAGWLGNATITLEAIDVSVGVGSVASFVRDASGTTSGIVHGGFTIAHGVTIENAVGGSGIDFLSGNAADNCLDGGAGRDFMYGFSGNDTYIVDNAADEVMESDGTGTDTILASTSFTISHYVEILQLTGSASINAYGNAFNNILIGNSGSNVLLGGDGADTLSGGDDADYLLIDAADTSVAGGAGFDSVFVQTSAAVTLNMGTASIEWAQGNAGADTFNAASQTGAVYIYGMGGDDTLTGSAFGDYLDGGDGTDTLEGGGGADLMLGNGGSDILLGQGGDDSLIELGGDSVIDGGAGFDSLFVWSDTGVTLNLTTASIEWVQGSVLGDDTLYATGNTVNTFLYGWGGNDKLRGGSGDDYIAGGAGDDILTGNAGNDTMIGEGGVDRYVYAAATWGSDTIHSFDPNGEKLDFRTVAGIDSFSDFTAYEWDPLGLGYNSTTLFYTDGGTTSAITLIGVQTASLSDADFLFA